MRLLDTHRNQDDTGWPSLTSLRSPRHDSFVILASVYVMSSGPFQASYSATKKSQEALVQHRNSLGEKAVSINLGVMVEDGALVEDSKLPGVSVHM